MYKVYRILPNQRCYSGESFVAASSVKEANRLIKAFRDNDVRNRDDSYGYSNVDEDDCLSFLRSTKEGIIIQGIWYNGG